MTPDRATPRARKPRIALMGEFSAGKSTLANILMRAALSRVQITATQMPPVWYVHGDGPVVRIGMDGSETPIGRDEMAGCDIAQTRALRVPAEADILEACDIIDMPGSSDPNITGDLWQAMLPLVDGVIWCSPATQAWRQSEAALWEEAPEGLHRTSLLLLTRIDKILSDLDRQRLLRRVRAEAGPMFREILPVALLAAEEAGEDADLLRASGMAEVLESLLAILSDLDARGLQSGSLAAPVPHVAPMAAAPLRRAEDRLTSAVLNPAPNPAFDPAPDLAAEAEGAQAGSAEPAAAAAGAAPSDGAEVRPLIRPRRVVLTGGGRGLRPRPRAESGGSLI